MSIDRARSDLTLLEVEINDLTLLLQQKHERAQKLRTFIELASEYDPLVAPALTEPLSPLSSAQKQQPEQAALPEDSPFYGKSLAAAALKVLEQANEPLTVAAITNTLKAAGWHFVSSNPTQAIYWALRKHTSTTGEAVTIPGPRWALTAWRPDHVAKSTAGLNAARARGVQLGPPKKMTDEKVAQLKELIAAGNMSNSQMAERLGVSRATINKYVAFLRESAADAPGREYLGPNVTRLVR